MWWQILVGLLDDCKIDLCRCLIWLTHTHIWNAKKKGSDPVGVVSEMNDLDHEKIVWILMVTLVILTWEFCQVLAKKFLGSRIIQHNGKVGFIIPANVTNTVILHNSPWWLQNYLIHVAWVFVKTQKLWTDISKIKWFYIILKSIFPKHSPDYEKIIHWIIISSEKAMYLMFPIFTNAIPVVFCWN